MKYSHAEAQNNLGYMYQEGEGVEPDDKRAVELFTLAADQGYAGAQFNLGNIYRAGRGVEPDKTLALVLMEKAAAQGFEKAKKVLREW